MLVNLLALTSIAFVPSTKPNYGYSADLVVQAQKRDSYHLGGNDYYSIDNRYVFYCHLFYNSENDYQLYYSGVQWYANVYNESNGELLQTFTESWYLEVDLELNAYSTFEISTYVGSQDNYCSDFDYGNNVFESYELELENYISSTSQVVYTQDNLCVWIPFFENDIPYIIKSNSYQLGYDVGYSDGMNTGNKAGYNSGYYDGYTDAQADGGVPAIIFGGVLNIAMIPVNFFLAILNFEVFGINIGGFVTGLMTIAVIIILFGVIFGGRPAPRGGPSGGGKNG